jgi:hypothetical protein
VYPWQVERIGTSARGTLRGRDAQKEVKLRWWDAGARRGKAAKPYGRFEEPDDPQPYGGPVWLPCLVCLRRLTPTTIKHRRRHATQDQTCVNCEEKWRKAGRPWGDEYERWRDHRRVLHWDELGGRMKDRSERSQRRRKEPTTVELLAVCWTKGPALDHVSHLEVAARLGLPEFAHLTRENTLVLFDSWDNKYVGGGEVPPTFSARVVS